MGDPLRVRVSGPLEPFAAGFAVWLSGWGYPPSSAARQLQLMAHVSRWLLAEGLGARELSDDAVEAFVVSRRACGYSGHRTSRALVGLLFYLRGVGAVPVAAEPSLEGPVERLLYRYRRYLVVERGVGRVERPRLCPCRRAVSGWQGLLGWSRSRAFAGRGCDGVRGGALSFAVAGLGEADGESAAFAARFPLPGGRD